MKLKLKQEKLQEAFEKLLIKDMFPSSIISTKESRLFSIQREEHGRAIRFVRFEKTFFDSIDDEPDILELDVEKTLGLIKELPANTPLIVETIADKLAIKKMLIDDKGTVLGEKGHTMKSYKEPEGKPMEKLPFEIKDGVPLLGEEKLPLDCAFTIDLEDLKYIANMGGKLKTDTYKFFYENGKVGVRIGDLHAFSDYDTEWPNGKILSGTDLSVMFTYGIPQIAETFRSKQVTFNTRTDSPVWVYEKTDTYTMGVFIPPYTEPA